MINDSGIYDKTMIEDYKKTSTILFNSLNKSLSLIFVIVIDVHRKRFI